MTAGRKAPAARFQTLLQVIALVALLLAAMFAGEATVEGLGDRAPFGRVAGTVAFLVFYWSFAGFVVVMASLLLGSVAPTGLVVGATFLGFVPEGLLHTVSRFVDSSPRLVDFARWADVFQAPGLLLFQVFVGHPYERFATGLVDPPVRQVLVEASLVGCLNGVAWLAIALIAHAVWRRR